MGKDSPKNSRQEKDPELQAPPIDASDTMWKIRAEETREKPKSGFFKAIFGKKEESEEQTSYSYDDFERLLQKGDMVASTKAAEYLMQQNRSSGEWWMVEDIYKRLMKRFPDALPTTDICAIMLAYGISKGKLGLAEIALRQLSRRDPRHEVIVKRLPLLVELCINNKEVRKAAYWLDRLRQMNAPYDTLKTLNDKLRDLDPSQAFADDWLGGPGGGAAPAKAPVRKAVQGFVPNTDAANPADKPDQPRSVIKTYTSLVLDGRYGDAYKVLEQCTTAPPRQSHPVDHIKLAEGLVRDRRFADALKVVGKVHAWHGESPPPPQALYIAAWLFGEIFKDTDKAIRALDVILQHYPGSVFAIKASNFKSRLQGEED